jgi:hypothetical protein
LRNIFYKADLIVTLKQKKNMRGMHALYLMFKKIFLCPAGSPKGDPGIIILDDHSLPGDSANSYLSCFLLLDKDKKIITK